MWNNGTGQILMMDLFVHEHVNFVPLIPKPKGYLDPNEPSYSANAVKLMDLDYVVITSVDRDDSVDEGQTIMLNV